MSIHRGTRNTQECDFKAYIHAALTKMNSFLRYQVPPPGWPAFGCCFVDRANRDFGGFGLFFFFFFFFWFNSRVLLGLIRGAFAARVSG